MKFIPKIVKWLIGINIGVYVLTLSLIHSYNFNLIEVLALQAGNDFKWYQLLTHSITHSTLMGHIIGNMTFFMLFAIFVQKRIGPTTCLLLYVYTAIISGLFWLGGHVSGGLVGASGVLFGFMTVFLFIPVEKWFFKALKILVIFTILLVIEIISCLFAHSLPSLSSRYVNTLFLTSFAIKNVSHTITMAQMRFITRFGSRRVLNQSIILVLSISCQLEGATA